MTVQAVPINELAALDTDDVARLLRSSRQQIRIWARSGVLPCFRAGRRWLFDPAAVEQFKKSGGNLYANHTWKTPPERRKKGA